MSGTWFTKVKLINNLVIIDEKGISHQIDHVAIRHNGIFCVETKNYGGCIYGNDQQDQWTQVLAFGKVKEHFYSPVKQNLTHVYQLSRILEGKYPITPIVVFVQDNTDYIDSKYVVGISDLWRKLKTYKPSKPLSNENMDYVFNVLSRANKSKEISNKEHIKDIEKQREEIENNICPRCGSPLVIRHGKYGIFYGCSSYPKCKFHKKV